MGYEATHASAFDFEALLDTPSDLHFASPAAVVVLHHSSAADFEALLTDDVTPVRSTFQLAEWAWQDSGDDVDVVPKRVSVAVNRKDIIPLPAGVGAISRALPKRKQSSAKKAKPASKKAKPMKASPATKAKPVKTSPKAKPMKTATRVKTSPKPLSHTRHCTISRVYKRARRETLCEIKRGTGCFDAGSLLFEPISICNKNEP